MRPEPREHRAGALLDDDSGQPGDYLPGDPGLWVFILADMAMFGVFFLIFTLGRVGNVPLFDASRQSLHRPLGVLNTLILLTSGWLMVQAVHAARHTDRARTVRFLALVILLGCGFVVSKITEYSAMIRVGISIFTNDFFMHYFIFTGFHFMHVLFGVAALSVTLAKARRDMLDRRYRVWIESVGCYWHMVDLLWVMLFAMLYLQSAA
jgi:nitric oxide reductase NorE protein